jgi:cyanophycinase-like exopeptidase
MAASYSKVFQRLGAAQAHDLKILGRGDADSAEAVAAVEHASGVFFRTGIGCAFTNFLNIRRLTANTSAVVQTVV